QSNQMRVPRQQITCSAKPRQERHGAGSVKPRNMCAAAQRTAQTSAGATVVPRVKGQVHLEGKMDVDRAREKRQHAEREAHDEAEEIKIRPGHTAPRAHSRCASWNRDADHQHYKLVGSLRWRMSAPAGV